jgi:hypothetical protein
VATVVLRGGRANDGLPLATAEGAMPDDVEKYVLLCETDRHVRRASVVRRANRSYTALFTVFPESLEREAHKHAPLHVSGAQWATHGWARR